MLSLSSKVNVSFETAMYLKRRYFNEEISTNDKKYSEVTSKLEKAYENLETTFLKIENQYAELFELLSLHNESSWIGFTLTKIIFLTPEKNNKERFAEEIYEWFEDNFHSEFVSEVIIDSESFFNFLENSDFSKEERWNIFTLYNRYDYYSNCFKEMLEELSKDVENELRKFDAEVHHLIVDWQKIIEKKDSIAYIYDKFHINLKNNLFENIKVYPSVFGVNGITWTDQSLFMGLVFDNDFVFKKTLTRENLCKYLKFLGDISRFNIITELLKRPMYGKELADILALTPATISYHMTDLAQEGFVRLVPGENKRVYYHLDYEFLKEIEDALNENLFLLIGETTGENQ